MCKNRDSETEMNEGNLPTINVNEDKNEKEKEINEVIDSEYINLNQERSYKIFEFFNDLRQNPKNYIEESKNYNLDDIIVIHFKSIDQQIDCAIKCVRSDTFAEVEEKLYQIYDEYRERNNNFLFQGRTILRFKKIYENNIKDGDKVQLIYDE